MKETIILWSIIILVVFSILFPPFGYTRVKELYIYNAEKPVDTMHELTEVVVPWTYVCHRFIFSAPPQRDPKLADKDHSHFVKHQYQRISKVEDMRISWSIVLLEIAAIIIVGMGMIFTMRTQKERVDS